MLEVYENGQKCGSAAITEKGLYLHINLCCVPERKIVQRAYLHGEGGYYKIGIPEPKNGEFSLVRDIPSGAVAHLGTLQDIVLRGAEETPVNKNPWKPLARPENFFSGGEPALRGVKNCMWRQGENRKILAVPFAVNQPFLLERYFCFAHIERIDGGNYAVFSFDPYEMPKI